MIKTFITLLILSNIGSVRADLTVFAAASTTDVMRELAQEFKKESGDKVRLNFASSGALARQIEAGAPADVYVSANQKWMDYLEQKNLVQSGSRINMAGNALVLIAPTGSTLKFDRFTEPINGSLAIGDPKAVPAGAYAVESLKALKWFDAIQSRLIKTKDVRTVLMYVERGEVDAGIVYASDAKASSKVKIIGKFPNESHNAILYPAAACSEKDGALQFLKFLKTDRAQSILISCGFMEPDQE